MDEIAHAVMGVRAAVADREVEDALVVDRFNQAVFEHPTIVVPDGSVVRDVVALGGYIDPLANVRGLAPRVRSAVALQVFLDGRIAERATERDPARDFVARLEEFPILRVAGELPEVVVGD